MYTLKRLGLENKERIKELFVGVFTKEPWYDDWSDKEQLDMYICDLVGQNYSLSYGLYDDAGELIGISLGYADDAEYWGIVGLLHDIDFELFPQEHCLKAPELLREGGVSEDIIHAVCSHGYGITVGCGVTIDVEPVHEMEKVLFAADELTGLVWAAALMRPSKSTKDMELKSLKKKYKSKGFAAGCSRDVIERGAEQLGWDLDKLLEMTLKAMAESEDLINEEIA